MSETTMTNEIEQLLATVEDGYGNCTGDCRLSYDCDRCKALAALEDLRQSFTALTGELAQRTRERDEQIAYLKAGAVDMDAKVAEIAKLTKERDAAREALSGNERAFNSKFDHLKARVRVLEEALGEVDATLCACRYGPEHNGNCNCDIHAAHRIARAALATPAEPTKADKLILGTSHGAAKRALPSPGFVAPNQFCGVGCPCSHGQPRLDCDCPCHRAHAPSPPEPPMADAFTQRADAHPEDQYAAESRDLGELDGRGEAARLEDLVRAEVIAVLEPFASAVSNHGQFSCLQCLKTRDIRRATALHAKLTATPAQTSAIQEQEGDCECRHCHKRGFALDEFTSPYTGLCADCDSRSLAANNPRCAACEGTGCTEHGFQDCALCGGTGITAATPTPTPLDTRMEELIGERAILTAEVTRLTAIERDVERMVSSLVTAETALERARVALEQAERPYIDAEGESWPRPSALEYCGLLAVVRERTKRISESGVGARGRCVAMIPRCWADHIAAAVNAAPSLLALVAAQMAYIEALHANWAEGGEGSDAVDDAEIAATAALARFAEEGEAL